MNSFNINNLVRENIRKLKPYQSAREEFKDDNSILLDANENPYENGYNRYPDPLQRELKDEIANQKGLSTENIFLGNGSDEIIDLLIRAFCEPGKDSILINTPTYGMYKVCANINNVKVNEVELDNNFQIKVKKILKFDNVKIIFICSPNNPTGNIFNRNSIITLLEDFNGLIVVDEAYIDFSDEPSFQNELSKYQNLIILQTFSKARAMAGIRLGMAFTNPEIVKVLNKIKYPYNVSLPSQQAALNAMQENRLAITKENILKQKKQLVNELNQLDFVLHIWSSVANFLLVKFKNHSELFKYLKDQKIIVRDRSNEPNCGGCLRITVGTTEENSLLVETLRKYKQKNKII
jgi:histidinol-phosphate aminotransferase